jgi:antitoxin MazE
MAKPSGGRRFSKTCLVEGREGDGRQAIIKTGAKRTRVAPIRDDGLTDDGAVVFPNNLILDIRAVDEAPPAPRPFTGIVGERGTIVLPAALRRRYDLEAGCAYLVEEGEGVVMIRPADVVPRQIGKNLDEMLAGVTPENLHGEVSTGPAVGKEAW